MGQEWVLRTSSLRLNESQPSDVEEKPRDCLRYTSINFQAKGLVIMSCTHGKVVRMTRYCTSLGVSTHISRAVFPNRPAID